MKLFQIIFLVLFISCSDKTNDSTTTAKKDKTKIVESVYPENNEPEVKDTLIKEMNLKVTITKIPLKTFVRDESTGKDIKKVGKKNEIINIKYIDKYRDYKICLNISQNSKTVFDTVFHKEQFKDHYTNPEIGKRILDYYSFVKLADGKLFFSGSLDKPLSLKLHEELFFNHYYDIQTKLLKANY